MPTIDPETGLDNQLSWSMAITIEEARSGRYGRPVSVVIAELDGLDKLAELLGADVADKLIQPVADALRSNARAADRVARLSHTRFGVLLVETDEIRAINYVERVRSACDTLARGQRHRPAPVDRLGQPGHRRRPARAPSASPSTGCIASSADPPRGDPAGRRAQGSAPAPNAGRADS